MMAATDRDQPSNGEQRLKRRRTAFWRFTMIGFAVAIVLGFAGGFMMAFVERGRLPALVVYLVTGAILAFYAWFSVAYYRRVDELEIQDNLWSALIAIYFHIVAFPVWNTLAAFDLLPPVNQWGLYISTIIVLLIAYCVRKLSHR